jgi:hypothetical protein
MFRRRFRPRRGDLPEIPAKEGKMGRFFAETEASLRPVLDELRRQEPIFHSEAFGLTAADFERRTAPDFWEVGASGRRYSRAFILGNANRVAQVHATISNWEARDHALRRLSADTYLMTYTQLQDKRLTRRSTLWQSTPEGWRILYHQGTIVLSEEDDVFPV